MNSVSIPSRPLSRAARARSETVVSTVAILCRRLRPARRPARRATRTAARRVGARGGAVRVGGALGAWLVARRRRLVRPVAVLAVELARGVLGVAVPLALHADAEDDVQQPHRRAGGDDRDAALPAGLATAARDDRDDARDHDGDRQPDADEAHHAASAVAVSMAGEKRSTSSAAVTCSPGFARPTVDAR